MYPQQRCSNGSVNETILKPRLTVAAGRQYIYVIFPHSRAYTISEKAIRFRHPDFNTDQAQKLISSSMSRHLSTRKISSFNICRYKCSFCHNNVDAKCYNHMRPNPCTCFWVILLTERQTDKQTNERTTTKTFTSSFVGGNELTKPISI